MSRVVLITGAGGGIGRATAIALAKEGDRIALLGRRQARLDRALSEIAAIGGGAAIYLCDVRSEEEVRRAVEAILKEFDRIDAAVLASGVFRIGSVQKTTPEVFREVVDTNLTGAFLVAREVLPGMLERRSGHLVFISSVAGRRVFPESSAYCASKWGVLGLAGAIREEVRGRDVRVTTVIPGAVATGMWDGVEGDWDRTRMLHAEDVARAIVSAITAAPSGLVEEIVLAPPGGDL